MKKGMLFLVMLLLTNLGSWAQALRVIGSESEVGFVIKNMGMDVNGKLKGLKGTLIFNPKKLKSSQFDMTVEVNTIETGIDKRDQHLKRADFFDAEKFPVIRIQSTKIMAKGKEVFYAEAILTMHGVSKKIQFDFIAKASQQGYTFSGGFPLNRLDYGIGKTSITMGDKVLVQLQVVAQKP